MFDLSGEALVMTDVGRSTCPGVATGRRMFLLSSSHQPSTLNHQLLPLHPPGSHRAKAIAAMDDEIELAVLRQIDEIALDGFHDWNFSRSGF